MNKSTLILAVASMILASNAWAETTLDPMFSDHMVLQREMPVPIWGTAGPGRKVTVSFRDQKKETTADKNGKWSVKLDPLKVGRPGKLTVAGKTTLVLDDVLVGDVWLGSGQSNMSRRVGKFAGGDDVLAAMAKAGPYPNLRLYRGDWKIAAADDINGFSALMFSFGVPLQKELDVPVGLIVGAVSRTAAGRWLSLEMVLADPVLKKHLEGNEEGKDHPWRWAEAKIEGDTVVVSCEKAPHPVHVRYKSHNSCSWANLFNKDRRAAFAFNTRWMKISRMRSSPSSSGTVIASERRRCRLRTRRSPTTTARSPFGVKRDIFLTPLIRPAISFGSTLKVPPGAEAGLEVANCFFVSRCFSGVPLRSRSTAAPAISTTPAATVTTAENPCLIVCPFQ